MGPLGNHVLSEVEGDLPEPARLAVAVLGESLPKEGIGSGQAMETWGPVKETVGLGEPSRNAENSPHSHLSHLSPCPQVPRSPFHFKGMFFRFGIFDRYHRVSIEGVGGFCRDISHRKG